MLDLLGLSNAHTVTAEIVSEETGEAHVANGVLAELDDGVPVGSGSESGPAPSGGSSRISDCIVVGEMLADEKPRLGNTGGEIRVLRRLGLAFSPGQSRHGTAVPVPNFRAALVRVHGAIR